MVKRLFFCFGLFILILLLVNYVHFRFFEVNVVLYSALLDVVLAVAVAGIMSWFFILRRNTPSVVFAQLLVIFALSGYIWAISVPTIIDRSYSMYLLEKLQQEGGKLSQTAFSDAILNEFERDRRLSDSRLTEQLQSGTISINNGCVSLTGKGRWIASVTHWYRENLLPDHRLLMGNYTDALTHSFHGQSALSNYHCS